MVIVKCADHRAGVILHPVFFSSLFLFFLVFPHLSLHAQEVVSGVPERPDTTLVPLTEDWEYRWSTTEAWKPIGFPSNPPDRDGRTEVWYRISLPSIKLADPRLYITSIDLGAEVYLVDEFLYRHNVPESEQLEKGDIPFQGWPWHLISLPTDFGGKLLEFRVFSGYKDIGLWGELRLGEGYDHIRYLFKSDAFGLVVCTFSLIISVIFFLIFFLNKLRYSSFILAMITFLLALRAASGLHVTQFVVNRPLFWEYIRIWSALLIPILIVHLIRRVFGRKYWRFSRTVLLVYSAVFVVSLITSLSRIVPLTVFYSVSDIVALTTIVVFLPLILMAGIKGNREARIIIVSLFGVATFVVYGVLMGNGVIPWSNINDNVILFIFVLGLVVVLSRRIILMYRRLDTYALELSVLNNDLETKVEERTQELETANRELRKTSITDGLTELYNRMYTEEVLKQMIVEAERYHRSLSVILFDIDDFKKINDSYGHQFGDHVLRSIGKSVKVTLRDSDVPGRYGGEEFLLILPEEDLQKAAHVAERIRDSVNSLRWENGCTVTISCGVAELNGEGPDELVHRADVSMYHAKHLGKNRVCT